MIEKEYYEVVWNWFKDRYGENQIGRKKLRSLMDEFYLEIKKKLCCKCLKLRDDVELRKVCTWERWCVECYQNLKNWEF